jgi:NitT/TauT family transport system substrate-binding protein
LFISFGVGWDALLTEKQIKGIIMQVKQNPGSMPGANQQPGTMPGMNNGDQQFLGQDQDIERLRSRTRRQFLAAAGGLAAGAALLVGGEAWLQTNPLASSPSKPACTTAALSPAHPVKLNVGEAGKSLAFFPYYVAQKEGFFLAHGLDMGDAIQLPAGTKVIAGVESGSLDIGNGVMNDAFTLTRTDATVRIIGSLLNFYAVDIVVRKGFEEEVGVSATSPLTERINALKGKTIGMTGPGTGTQAMLTYLFRLLNLDATKVTTQVNLGAGSTAAVAALKSGRVDAMSYFIPFGELAEAKGFGDIFISPLHGDVPGLTGEVQGIYYTRQSVIDAKPQAIAAYIRAMSDAGTFIHNNPDKTKTYLTQFLGLSASVANTVYTTTLPYVPQNPQISQSSYNIAGNFHVKAGLVSVIPSYSKLVATDVIDSALATGTIACPS